MDPIRGFFSNINGNDKIHDTERTDMLEFKELSKILPITTIDQRQTTLVKIQDTKHTDTPEFKKLSERYCPSVKSINHNTV